MCLHAASVPKFHIRKISTPCDSHDSLMAFITFDNNIRRRETKWGLFPQPLTLKILFFLPQTNHGRHKLSRCITTMPIGIPTYPNSSRLRSGFWQKFRRPNSSHLCRDPLLAIPMYPNNAGMSWSGSHLIPTRPAFGRDSDNNSVGIPTYPTLGWDPDMSYPDESRRDTSIPTYPNVSRWDMSGIPAGYVGIPTTFFKGKGYTSPLYGSLVSVWLIRDVLV